jgi:hypothetical protein
VPIIGYKRRRGAKGIITHGAWPSDIDSNEDISTDADNAPGPDKDICLGKDPEDRPKKAKRQKNAGNEVMQCCLTLLLLLPTKCV